MAMKRLIIFRHGDYDIYKNLTETCAQELFLKVRRMKQFFGLPAAIFASPIRRAWQTACVINLALGNVPLFAKDELRDFCALSMPYFAKRFAADAQKNFAAQDVLLWVTHEPSIHELLGISLDTSEWIVLEAPEWEMIFEPKFRKIYRSLNFLTNQGCPPNEVFHQLVAWTQDTLSDDEKQKISSLLK